MDNPSQPPNEQMASSSRGDRLIYVLPDSSMSAGTGDEVDIFDLWNIIWADKWLIAAIVAAFVTASVVYALSATEWYQADVLLAPTVEDTTQDLMGSLGGLANLAGLNVSGAGNKTVEALAVLKSREFTREFIEHERLLTELFADDWDAQARAWKSDDPAEQPDMRDAVKFFDESIRNVEEDSETGLVALSITWTDPAVAARWANLLVQTLNARMRQRAQVEAQRNVDYLQEQLVGTSLVMLQQSISRLLENELQKLMLARGTEQFSFRIIDRAETPKYRSSPKRTLVVVFATVLGGFLSILIALMRHAVRTRAGKGSAGVAQ